MATYQTPQGERRIIVREITVGGDHSAKVEGFIIVPGLPSVDFSTYVKFRPTAESDDTLFLAMARIEVLLAEAVALQLGILPANDDEAAVVVERGERI